VIPRGATINSEAYINALNKFKKRFRQVWPGKNPAEMLLQHDNARPHTSLRTREHITKMSWTVLPHPPYNPDLAPSDFHLFGSLKCFEWNSLWRWQQRNWSVRKWLCRHDKSWYWQGIHALAPRWHKAVKTLTETMYKNSVCKRNIHLHCHQISTILNKHILRRKKMWGKTFWTTLVCLLTTNSMELSPSWEATSCAVTQEFTNITETESSLPCSQEPSTSPYP
jgi:hypothetical protein